MGRRQGREGFREGGIIGDALNLGSRPLGLRHKKRAQFRGLEPRPLGYEMGRSGRRRTRLQSATYGPKDLRPPPVTHGRSLIRSMMVPTMP